MAGQSRVQISGEWADS